MGRVGEHGKGVLKPEEPNYIIQAIIFMIGGVGFNRIKHAVETFDCCL